MKLRHLDSGILYRRLALILLENNIKFDDVKNIKKKLERLELFLIEK